MGVGESVLVGWLVDLCLFDSECCGVRRMFISSCYLSFRRGKQIPQKKIGRHQIVSKTVFEKQNKLRLCTLKDSSRLWNVINFIWDSVLIPTYGSKKGRNKKQSDVPSLRIFRHFFFLPLEPKKNSSGYIEKNVEKTMTKSLKRSGSSLHPKPY